MPRLSLFVVKGHYSRETRRQHRNGVRRRFGALQRHGGEKQGLDPWRTLFVPGRMLAAYSRPAPS